MRASIERITKFIVLPALIFQGCALSVTEQVIGRANTPRPSVAAATGQPRAPSATGLDRRNRVAPALPNQIPIRKDLVTKYSVAQHPAPDWAGYLYPTVDAMVFLACAIPASGFGSMPDCLPNRPEPLAMRPQKRPVMHPEVPGR